MQRIKLVSPDKAYMEQVLNYKKEFIENHEDFAGSGGLRLTSDYDEWLTMLDDNSSDATVRDGLVPASTYLAVTIEDHQLVGMIDIRHRLNEYLENFGGHIGYSIKRSERRQGYATEMLKLALDECKKLQISTVLVTCDKENIGSVKTIINNGGQLINEVPEDYRITQRYHIHL